MIGAGGAARGIAFALHTAGTGRFHSRIEHWKKLNNYAAELPDATVLSIAEAEQSLAEFGLIVQTTSVGMNFAQQGMPLDPENVCRRNCCCRYYL